jgi:hypothetical protein
MKNQVSEDSLETTISACAWLVDIAQRSVDLYGWDPVIVRYLEQLGKGAHEAQLEVQGGMGAVASMKRSVTAVEVLAHLPACRGAQPLNDKACPACHAKQVSFGGELMQ